jgi:hypothetical protein
MPSGSSISSAMRVPRIMCLRKVRMLLYKCRSSLYASAVAKDATGRISTAPTEPPIHSPQVSEPVTVSPPNAPASITVSSSTTAKAAARNTNSKWPHTSSLLRLKAANDPRRSLTITGANNDQRVSSHRPGITSRLAAAVGSMIAANEATVTSGTTGAARSRFRSTLGSGISPVLRRASNVSSSA